MNANQNCRDQYGVAGSYGPSSDKGDKPSSHREHFSGGNVKGDNERGHDIFTASFLHTS